LRTIKSYFETVGYIIQNCLENCELQPHWTGGVTCCNLCIWNNAWQIKCQKDPEDFAYWWHCGNKNMASFKRCL